MSTSSHPLSQWVNRVFSFSRRTWILITVSVALLIALILWATIMLASWLFGMAKDTAIAIPDVARVAIQQVEQAVPGATQAIEDLRTIALPAAAPARDASGSDPVAVERFPGFIRTHWQREGQELTVRYEGKADLPAVLNHYTQRFSGLGYQQELNAATQNEESHDYIKGSERVRVTFTQQKGDMVSVSIAVQQPSAGG